MADPYIINISSDEEEPEDIELLEFRKETQDLINNNVPQNVKKLLNCQCPICFDEITIATLTSCGHIFCLDCISQSISSSYARGQVRGRRGVGLCPLCRKSITFKESVVLRIKLANQTSKPSLPPLPTNDLSMNEVIKRSSEDNAPESKKQKIK